MEKYTNCFYPFHYLFFILLLKSDQTKIKNNDKSLTTFISSLLLLQYRNTKLIFLCVIFNEKYLCCIQRSYWFSKVQLTFLHVFVHINFATSCTSIWWLRRWLFSTSWIEPKRIEESVLITWLVYFCRETHHLHLN